MSLVRAKSLGLTRKGLVTTVLVAIACFVVARLCVRLGLVHGGAAAACPAAGVAIGAIVLLGPITLPGIAIGSLAGALALGNPIGSAALVMVAALSESLVAYTTLTAWGFQANLRRISDVVAFVGFGAVLASAAGAVFGALSVVAAGQLDHQSMLIVWRDWALVDFARILIPGTMLLVIGSRDLRTLFSRPAIECVAALVPVGAFSLLLLHSRGSLPYLVLPLLFFLAVAYRQCGAVLGTAVIGLITVLLTAHGHGPFVAGSETASLIRAETFIAVGAVTALLVAAALSERRFAETAMRRLAESERALAEAQRLGGIGSFEIDLFTLESSWSEELYRILGRTPDDGRVSWRIWHERVLPEDREELDRQTRELYEECGSGHMVHRIRRADGQVRWIDAKVSYERDRPDGPPVRVRGTVQDVTTLKLAEDRLRALFEHAPYPIVVVDENGAIHDTNRPAQEMFGQSAGELKGYRIEHFVFQPSGEPTSWYWVPDGDGGNPDVDLWGRRPDGAEFPLEVFLTPLVTEEGTLMSVALRDVTKLREAAELLQFEARHDALTGLPNRLMFIEQLNLALVRARKSGHPLAVVFADLDGFKQVNDSGGHEVGDLLLKELKPRLHAAVRHGDLVARLGGDEFVILCEDMLDEGAAISVAQRLSRAAAQPFELAGRQHKVSLSAGIVMVNDPENTDVDSVLREADAAMYAAKAEGKGRVRVFDPAGHLRVWDAAGAA